MANGIRKPVNRKQSAIDQAAVANELFNRAAAGDSDAAIRYLRGHKAEVDSRIAEAERQAADISAIRRSSAIGLLQLKGRTRG